MSATNPILAAAMKHVNALSGNSKLNIADGPAPAMRGAPNDVVATMRGTGYLGINDQPSGASVLNPKAQLGLFRKIRKKAGWARFISFQPTSANSGQLDLWSDENFKMHPTASEGPRTGIPLHKPDVSQVTFETSTISGAFGLRLRAIKAAARAGQNVNELIQSGVAAGIANVLLDIGINGNTALPADTDENKMRRACNGWIQKLRSQGVNYTSQDDGFSYHNKIWAGMLQQLDAGYRNDAGLAWGSPDVLGTRYLTELSGMEPASSASTHHMSKANSLAAQVLQGAGQVNPLGKPFITIPQIETDRYGTEGYAGMAPTSITDNGDGTLTININTLAGSGTDRSSTGADGQRYVTVGCTATGIEETIAVDFSTPNNTVTTASLLGQTAASTTAADYYVKWADLTSMFLGIFRMMVIVVQNGIRVYTTFYPRDEVLEIIIHADVDYVPVDPEAFSLVDDIIAPRFNILP